MPDLQENFYTTLETSPEHQDGLRAHEAAGLHEILEAFQNLKGPDEQSLPVKLTFDEGRAETERVLVAFAKIHGWGDR